MKQDIKALWKNLADNKRNTRAHHVQYCILRAIAAKGEDKVAIAKHLIRKAFSPISNANKLANGATPFGALHFWNSNAAIFRLGPWDSEVNKHPKIYTTVLDVPVLDVLTEEEADQFGRILSAVTPKSLVRRYSYFFTRQDIFEEYQLVQTAHAALELGSKLKPEEVKDLHFTCCGVADLRELENVERVLESLKIPFVVFREPDIGNEKTSIGVYPIEEHKRGILRSYNLLRFSRGTLEDIVASMVEPQNPEIESVM